MKIFNDLPAFWEPDEAMNRIADALCKGDSQGDIATVGLMLVDLLLQKNAAYGDSALAPVAVFAQGLSPSERMAVRLDDKVSRIMRGHDYGGEDAKIDLAGYLLLDYIARQHNA